MRPSTRQILTALDAAASSGRVDLPFSSELYEATRRPRLVLVVTDGDEHPLQSVGEQLNLLLEQAVRNLSS